MSHLTHDAPRKPWRARMVDRAPLPLLTHAYESGVAIVLCVLALPVVTGTIAPTSVHAQLPHWLAVAWGWALLLGAAFTLVGLFQYRPRVEWVGQLWIGYALGIYATAIGANAKDVSAASGPIYVFAGLALIAFWRAWKITSAPYIQYRLTCEANDAHRRAAAQRNDGR